MAGEILVDGQTVTRPGKLISEGEAVTLMTKMPFVSRGGLKLAHALSEFRIDVAGKVAADIGASTGGFADCLLQKGASRVYAVDVGYGQLDYRLRRDPRVTVMERVNARYPFELPEKVDLATIDLSFISTTLVIPNLMTHLKEKGLLVVLFKPQFEALREEVGKGGIIKDPQVHARVIGRFVKWLMNQPLDLGGLTTSPVLGAEGNREFLVVLRKREQT